MLPNSFLKKTTFLLLCLLAIGTTQLTAQWNELGGLNSLGANAAILSTCRDGAGNVYAAGNFTNSSGKHYVAKYDGKSWSELGGLNSLGFRQLIYSVCSDPAGNIYAAGYDAIVAKYDGKSWSELGGAHATPSNFFIQALCSDAVGNIYAAGTISDSIDFYCVAKYDGKSWSVLGGDNHLNANYFIQTICTDPKGNIYAAGGFTNSGIDIANFDSLYSGGNPSRIGYHYVAKYDGKSWSELGGKDALGANSWINSVYSDAAGNIYAAGWFTNSSGNNYVAKFDGTSWSELGGKDALAAQGQIYSVCSDPKGNIYAGGAFWNKSNYNYIAKYDGNSWSSLGGDTAFRTYDYFWSVFSDPFGNIYTGGSFVNSSKKSYVAKYGPSCTPTTDTITQSASGSYSWHGTTYTLSGKYSFDTTNATGCDSLTTLNLTIIPAPITNSWTGAVSNDWFDVGNWTVGVPTNTTDATIPVTPNKPVITSGTASVRNLAIDAGQTLTNNTTLSVNGDLTNNGSLMNSITSNVVLLGTGTLVGNNTFSNLEIQGNYKVGSTTLDKVAVTGILKKSSGTFTTSDKLTLVSNANGSALIQENGGTLTGKAYIQHYTSGANGYHHFSSPVSGATVSSWSNSFPITGPNALNTTTSKQFGTLQVYDEVDNTTSLLDSSYYNYTSLSGALTPGKGFTAWLNSLPTLNTFGTPNNGTITIPLTHSAGSNAPRGWNFVGNPYPSPISWTALKSLNPGLFGDASCYLWKSSGGHNGTWVAFDGTVGTNGAGDIINSSLGFFVYVNATGTLTFDNSVRNYSYLSPEIFGTLTASNQIRVSVSDAVSGETDEAVAYTSNTASISRKMQQPLEALNPTIAFDVNRTKVAINTLKSIDESTVLPLTITTPKAGNYTLKFTAHNTSLPVYLKDAVTGTLTDVKANSEVFITTTATETANRYSIVFSAPIAEANNAYNVFAKANSIVVSSHNTTGATILVYNTLGQQVAKAIATSTTTTIPVSSTASHYVVKILDNKGTNVVKHVIVK